MTNADLGSSKEGLSIHSESGCQSIANPAIKLDGNTHLMLRSALIQSALVLS